MNCWSSEGKCEVNYRFSEGKREVNYWFSEVDVRSELLVFGGKARSDGFESVCCWVVRFAARDVARESAVFHSGPTSEGVCRAFPPIAFLLYGSDSSG